MRQLWILSGSYQLYATVIGSMRQLSVLCDSYQLYATVISPIRQLLGLCDRYESMRQLSIFSDSYKKKNLLYHYWATVLLIDFAEILDELVSKTKSFYLHAKSSNMFDRF